METLNSNFESVKINDSLLQIKTTVYVHKFPDSKEMTLHCSQQMQLFKFYFDTCLLFTLGEIKISVFC